MLRATVMVVNAGKRHRARVRASRRRSSECRVGYFRAISTANIRCRGVGERRAIAIPNVATRDANDARS